MIKSVSKRPAGRAAFEGILVEGENVAVIAQIHPAIYWKGVAVVFFGFLVALIAPLLGAFFGFVGLMMLALAILTKHFLLLVLTNKRVLTRYGVLQVDVVDMHFRSIESVETERMLPGQIFGYANIVIMGTGQRYIRIPFVANALEFRRAYDEISLAREDAALVQPVA